MRLDGWVTADADWTVVIPVKTLAEAKSRMDPAARESGELAMAFFLDTLDATRACTAVTEILVATSDARVADAAVSAGCTVVSDAGHPGINAAAQHAAAQRIGTGGLAVIVSDLPCLTASALSAVIAAAGSHPTSFLADADGEGTTIWLARQGESVEPRFGVRSRAAHASTGATDLVHADPDLVDSFAPARRDVDTREALELARPLGLGQHTLSVVGVAPGRLVTVAGTTDDFVRVVDEAGLTAHVPLRVVTRAGLLSLHRGQRLVLENGADGTVAAVRLP